LLLLAGTGCAVTDYGVITDNDQVRAGQDNPGEIVNTNGKAHHYECSSIATIWPDGTDELFSFVDQQADGTSTITTYNNFSTGDEPTFHSDLYCNTDWSGCAIFTAPDDNDVNLFDGTTNTNCSGARSLSLLLSTGRYYGECGRRNAKFTLDQKMAALNRAELARRFGRNGLLWRAAASNTSLRATNAETGQTFEIPLFGARVEHFASEVGNAAFTWFDHAMLGPAMTNLASMLEDELSSEALIVEVEYNGITAGFHVAGGANELVREHVRQNARRL
jgi:hypothetical protein